MTSSEDLLKIYARTRIPMAFPSELEWVRFEIKTPSSERVEKLKSCSLFTIWFSSPDNTFLLLWISDYFLYRFERYDADEVMALEIGWNRWKCWNPSWKWNFMANVLYISSLDRVDWDRSYTAENKRFRVSRSVQETEWLDSMLRRRQHPADIAPSIDIIYAYKDLNKSPFYVDDFSLHCAPENNQLSSSIIPLNSVDWTSLSIQL